MNVVDLIIILVLFLFAVRGMLRGFLSEVQSSVGLLLGILLAQRYSYLIVPHIGFVPQSILPPVSFLLTAIIATFAIGIIISFLIPILENIITRTLNKILGSFAGLFKGFVTCTVIIYIANILFATNPALTDSLLASMLSDTAAWLLEKALDALPEVQIS